MCEKKMTIHSCTKACRWACLLSVAVLLSSLSEAFQIPSPTKTPLYQKYTMKNTVSKRRAPALGMATWSNGQAIKEYQGELSGTSCFSYYGIILPL